MDKLITMFMNRLIRQFTRTGVNLGIDLAAGKGKNPKDMTPQEREQHKKMAGMAKQAKKMQRISRRIL